MEPFLVVGVLLMQYVFGRNNLAESIPLQVYNVFESKVFFFFLQDRLTY